MIKISKSILILLISFIFLGSANADRLTWSTLLFPKLEKFNDCVTNLINQDIDNEHQLCTEKYGKEIPDSFINRSGGSGYPSAQFSFDFKNISDSYTIKAIRLTGYFQCKKDRKDCKIQRFDVKKNTSISPGSEEYETFYASDVDIELPDDIEHGEWEWRITSAKYTGFKISY